MKLKNYNASFPSTLRPPGKWKTASDVSCILDTLSSSAIDRIAADMPAEVLITTECPKRDYTFSSKLVRLGQRRGGGDALHLHPAFSRYLNPLEKYFTDFSFYCEILLQTLHHQLVLYSYNKNLFMAKPVPLQLEWFQFKAA